MSRGSVTLVGVWVALAFYGSPGFAADAGNASAMDNALPRAPAPFGGRIGRTVSQSVPEMPQASAHAPAGDPNIIVVMTDDTGFAASSAFGGPVPTPNLEKLAAHGLRYNAFQTTALCSPSRAALLTGRNHNAVGIGAITEFLPTGYPGYTGIIPLTAAPISRILQGNGYSTAMFGKNHNTPATDISPAGPFNRWPTGMGFDYFYGFNGGDSNQFTPILYEGTSRVTLPKNDPGYILDRDLADHAINWIHNQKANAPDKPFFIYYAPGTTHAPHQALPDWIAKFHGKFDQGWDKIREEIFARQKAAGVIPADAGFNPRPKQIPAWDSLTDTEKRIDARYMEVYAAMLSYQDAQFGRIADELGRMGQLDNTLIIFIEGDNGASGEGGIQGIVNEFAATTGESEDPNPWLSKNLDKMGGPMTYQIYPAGWAFALDTPFQWMKQVASHLGGQRTGMVVSWPDRIKDQGAIRPQYHHLVDIAPTLLEATHIQAPATVDGIAQKPLDGVSMMYSFADAKAPSTHRTQYYEIFGYHAIYHDGWLANSKVTNLPWNIAKSSRDNLPSNIGKIVVPPEPDPMTEPWELYDLTHDYSQSIDLADKYPEKLKEMRVLFDAEARRNDAYPIQTSRAIFRNKALLFQKVAKPLNYVYWGTNIHLTQETMPPIFREGFSLEADVEVPKHATGVLIGAGSYLGGWAFYLKDGKPVAYDAIMQLPGDQYWVRADKPIPAGPAKIRYDFERKGMSGVMTISVDGVQFAKGSIERVPLGMAGLGETFDIGRDAGLPVAPDYKDEGVFPGVIKKIAFTRKPAVAGGKPVPASVTPAISPGDD